jgi:hypothetical protein
MGLRVIRTKSPRTRGGYWICSWDGEEVYDLSPGHPYPSEEGALEAARQAIAQRGA